MSQGYKFFFLKTGKQKHWFQFEVWIKNENISLKTDIEFILTEHFKNYCDKIRDWLILMLLDYKLAQWLKILVAFKFKYMTGHKSISATVLFILILIERFKAYMHFFQKKNQSFFKGAF